MRTSLNRFSLATALTASAFAIGCGDGADPTTAELDPTEIAEIEALAEQAIAKGIPGVALVIQAGNQTVKIARGVEDRATGVPVTADHHFRGGSVAKSVLSAITLQLVEEGKLRLSDTVESHLPGLVSGNSHATIEQVLRLQSGIFDHASDPRYLAPYLEGNFQYAYVPQQLVALSNDHPPVFAPGERFQYSNTNYVIIGLIIEKLTGLQLADAVAQRITGPLGMTTTSMPLVSEMQAPFAHGYLVGMGDPIDVTGISASSAFGHGNFVSTPRDLNTFYGALVEGKVVNPTQLPAMFAPDPKIETHYAMGLWVWDDWPCGAWIGHDGSAPGFDTFAYSRRDGRRQVTVQISSLSMDDKAGDEAAHQAWGDLVRGAACK
jgi:D-alanyl-D-alanine carboxypeptidase